MDVRVLAQQQAAGLQVAEDRAVGRLEVQPAHQGKPVLEAPVRADGVEDGQALALPDREVVHAKGRCDVDDPRARVGRHEIARDDAPDVARAGRVVGQRRREPVQGLGRVERRHVGRPDEFGAHASLDDLARARERADERLGDPHVLGLARVVGRVDFGVHDGRADGEGRVRGQRPRRRRPREQARAGLAVDREADRG